MGKDNITFHTVMWPSILMGVSDGQQRYELPDDIVASEHLHMEGKKLSTSRGQVIYVKDVLDRYDADALRYYLMIAGPGEPGHRLHLGGVRAAQQRRAGRHVGQPCAPDARQRAQELRRRCPNRER